MLSQLRNLNASVVEAQTVNFIIEKWKDSFEASLWENHEVPKLSRISGRLYLAIGFHEFFVTVNGGIIHSVLYDKYIEIITPKVVAKFMSKSINEFFESKPCFLIKDGNWVSMGITLNRAIWDATFPANN